MSIEIVLLICGLLNITFLICGYKIGAKRQIITITKGDKIDVLERKEEYADEEATVVTPEMEREYEAMLRKQGGTNGMAT